MRALPNRGSTGFAAGLTTSGLALCAWVRVSEMHSSTGPASRSTAACALIPLFGEFRSAQRARAKFTVNARHQTTTVSYRRVEPARQRVLRSPLLPLSSPRSIGSLTSPHRGRAAQPGRRAGRGRWTPRTTSASARRRRRRGGSPWPAAGRRARPARTGPAHRAVAGAAAGLLARPSCASAGAATTTRSSTSRRTAASGPGTRRRPSPSSRYAARPAADLGRATPAPGSPRRSPIHTAVSAVATVYSLVISPPLTQMPAITTATTAVAAGA